MVPRILMLVLVVGAAACASEQMTGPAAVDAARRYQATAPAASAVPLFFLNGKEISDAEARAIDPAAIADIEILKGSAALATFGERGRHGVVQVRTKGATESEAR